MKAEEFATGILDALDEGLFQNVYRLASVELSEVVKDFPLEVYVVTYAGAIHPGLQHLEATYTPE